MIRVNICGTSDAIFRFLSGMEFQNYLRDELVQAAVERKFEIVGEALNKLSRTDADLAGQIPDIRGAIAFRNVLIHGYNSVDHASTWRIIRKSLPQLRSAAAKLLEIIRPAPVKSVNAENR